MKKVLFLVFVLFVTLNYAQERALNIGINGGVTTGDVKSFSSAGFGADVNYLFNISGSVSIGPSLGLIYFLPKSTEEGVLSNNSLTYVPIAAAVRFNSLGDDFFVGLDAGYAIGISPSGDRGGILFKPMVGYHINEKLQLNLFYTGVKKKNPTYSYVGIGLSYNLFGTDDYNNF